MFISRILFARKLGRYFGKRVTHPCPEIRAAIRAYDDALPGRDRNKSFTDLAMLRSCFEQGVKIGHERTSGT